MMCFSFSESVCICLCYDGVSIFLCSHYLLINLTNISHQLLIKLIVYIIDLRPTTSAYAIKDSPFKSLKLEEQPSSSQLNIH